MVKAFLYTELEPKFDKSPNKVMGVYLWMHEYCIKYLNEHEKIEAVTLTLDGPSHEPHMRGKKYTFDRKPKPEDVKLRVNDYLP